MNATTLQEIETANRAHWEQDYTAKVLPSDAHLRARLTARATDGIRKACDSGEVFAGEFGPCGKFAFKVA